MPRPNILTKGRPTDPFEKSSISDTERKLKELGARQRAALDARTPEDEKDKLEKAKKMKVEMIDPALAITGAVAGGVVAGNLINRIRKALDLNKEIKKAKQAAERPIKMPPMRSGPRK